MRTCSKNGCLLLAFFLIFLLFAELKAGDFGYSVSNGEATITSYSGTGGAVVIPAFFGSYRVTAIGPNAFYGSALLTGVVIPEGVTLIDIF
jgi:hypothetical protein